MTSFRDLWAVHRSGPCLVHKTEYILSANAAADKITSLPGLDKLPAFDMYSGYLNITGTVQFCVNLTVHPFSGMNFRPKTYDFKLK